MINDDMHLSIKDKFAQVQCLTFLLHFCVVINVPGIIVVCSMCDVCRPSISSHTHIHVRNYLLQTSTHVKIM